MNPSPSRLIADGRTETRKVLRCHGKLLQKTAPPLIVTTIDISSDGIAVMAPENVPPGDICCIAFDTLVNGKPIHLQAISRVIYSICVGTAGFRVGLLFTELDSVTKATLSQLMA